MTHDHWRLYLPDTNVLLTRFLSPDGGSRNCRFYEHWRLGRGSRLVRRVKAACGTIRFWMRRMPRFDYASRTTSQPLLFCSGRPTAGRRPIRCECRHIASNEITDLGQLDVRSRIAGVNFWIERIVALLGKYCRHPFAPDLLHRGQDTQLVVDEHVVVGGIEARDVIKLPLFVDVDEDAVLECLPKAGSFHFARLEHGIAVGEDDGGPPLLDMLHRVQSAGI